MMIKKLKTEDILFYKTLCNMNEDEVQNHQIKFVNDTFYYMIHAVKEKLKLSDKGAVSAFNMAEQEILLFITGTDFTRGMVLLDEYVYEKLVKFYVKLMTMSHKEVFDLMVMQFGEPKQVVKAEYFTLD